MLLNSAVAVVAAPLTTTRFSVAIYQRRRKSNTISPFVVAFSNQSQTLQLRTQLDQLHVESELTRSKANNARLRLMRLSEAAENLKRRAATSVLIGKENEARELLVQKKKLMQALERSKNRIEVLDELSAKINEAISLKETELIKYVAMHPEIGREDPTQKIRFASAKCHSNEVSDEANDSTVLGEIHSLDLKDYSDDIAKKSEELEYELSENSINSNDNNMIGGLKGLSSYRDLLEHIDMQLRLVEADVKKFMQSQLLIAESKQKKSIELQKLSEISKDILSIRERIRIYLETHPVNYYSSQDCKHHTDYERWQLSFTQHGELPNIQVGIKTAAARYWLKHYFSQRHLEAEAYGMDDADTNPARKTLQYVHSFRALCAVSDTNTEISLLKLAVLFSNFFSSADSLDKRS